MRKVKDAGAGPSRPSVIGGQYTPPERDLIEAFLLRKLGQAEQAQGKLAEAYQLTGAENFKNNLDHWSHVISGIKWCLTSIRPTQRKKRAEPTNTGKHARSATGDGGPAEGGGAAE